VSQKPLLVVESPTKVKTLKKFLGDAYNVAATVGHIKDLPSKEIGIDIENGFQPQYRVIPGKQKIISTLKHAAGDAEDIFLAPDPDREGEAIAWHTAEILKKKGRRFHRVLFHELTHHGISEAMSTPQELNASKYDAQKARRILDRLVGYQISPLLWRKVKNGLSAGRVQSVAVRIICERERAIQAFVPTEYWSVTAHLDCDQPSPFTARLVRRGGEKIDIPDQRSADAILAELAGHRPVVRKVIQKLTHRNPQPPFTTSKLQQDAIRRLRFSAKKTMVIAQQLYEGIELGSGDTLSEYGNLYFVRNCTGEDEIEYPEYIMGNIIVGTASNFVCGYVVDPEMNEIEGATVELWSNFPMETPLMTTVISLQRGHAFAMEA